MFDYVQKFQVVQIAEAPRSAQTGHYDGHDFEVVVTPDATQDHFVLDVYVAAPGGVLEPIEIVDNLETSEQQAFSRGWAVVADWLGLL